MTTLSLDLETYSPGLPPWNNGFSDPIVSVALVSEEDGITTCTVLIAAESKEKELLRRTTAHISSDSPERILWYNGDRFDYPVLLQRARRCGLVSELTSVLAEVERIDIWRMATEDPECKNRTKRFRQKDVEQLLGFSRVIDGMDGRRYFSSYEAWRNHGDPTAILYNLEDAYWTLRIFRSLSGD